jgi:hypothetical protein
VAWLEARLALDPQLRRSIKRVLAALRRAEAPWVGAELDEGFGVPVTALLE